MLRQLPLLQHTISYLVPAWAYSESPCRAQFARLSVLSDLVNTIAVAVQVVFFAAAVLSYVVHGWLADTGTAGPSRVAML